MYLGPADFEIAYRRREARIGNLAPDPADHWRHFCRQARLALSRLAPHGGGRLDFFFLGRVREQPAREILSLNQSWNQATRNRNQAMGPGVLGDCSSFGDVVERYLTCRFL